MVPTASFRLPTRHPARPANFLIVWQDAQKGVDEGFFVHFFRNDSKNNPMYEKSGLDFTLLNQAYETFPPPGAASGLRG
ncbi:hypothetical protein GCM10028804_42790 [Larkinella terrae]